MNKEFLITLIIVCSFFFYYSCKVKDKAESELLTFTNPLNLNYRFDINNPSHRTAADPVVILFKDKYYLFASKAGGYWSSENLAEWRLIEPSGLQLENYAPAVIAINDTIYFMANSHRLPDGTYSSQAIYKTTDPDTGKWEIANPLFPFSASDPAFFLDDDGKLFLYFGLGRNGPVKGVELNIHDNLNPVGDVFICFIGNAEENGWERRGDNNENTDIPYIEGAWMNKYKGKYYLQYAAPGTQFKIYGDGVYTSENPRGPFNYAENNPFSIKPGGFVNGAGHGCTFRDKYGNWWHIATTVIAVRHHWERRIGLFPAGFDKEGILFSLTSFSDYPMIIPDQKLNSTEDIFCDWMLLSYNKPFEASSSLDNHPGSLALDEDNKTYWCANTGNTGEYFIVDLGQQKEIHAVQINYAEHLTNIFGRDSADYHSYILYASDNNLNWTVLIDKADNLHCIPHDYIQFKKTVKARYVKIENIHVPDGMFALSGFRVFGKGKGQIPEQVSILLVKRNQLDPREVDLTWKASEGATGYLVRFGNQKDKLYQSQIVFADTSLHIKRLNRNSEYFFTVDAFNESGITKGTN